MSSSAAADTFVVNISGTVEGLGEAAAFDLSNYSTLNLFSGGIIRTASSGGIQRYAIQATGNSVLNLDGTVETAGANQSHGVLISGRDTQVAIGSGGRIIDLSSGIVSVVGGAGTGDKLKPRPAHGPPRTVSRRSRRTAGLTPRAAGHDCAVRQERRRRHRYPDRHQ